MKTYHLAMVPDKKSGGLGTLLKIGLVIGGAYLAYTQLSDKDKAQKTSRDESPKAGTTEATLGLDKAARDVSDFAARVLKAAKKVPDAIKSK
ncbi:MAG: hypothetical protein LBN36_00585 [Clostridiales Family XIII bacterium]|jgi:uncharacterized membrane protein YebE (DUF533 family)|nr:hypothetical protein [Clostridiales Family XIII bacterium]